MTDRELLELAAKAAGIELKPMSIKPADGDGDGFIGFMTDADQWKRGWFNPLADDGDAFRLAVKLRMLVDHIRRGHMERHVVAVCGAGNSCVKAYEPDAPAPYAATRRAVVRAAAEIGAAMTVQPEGEQR